MTVTLTTALIISIVYWLFDPEDALVKLIAMLITVLVVLVIYWLFGRRMNRMIDGGFYRWFGERDRRWYGH